MPESILSADSHITEPPDTYTDLSPWTRCISRGWNGIGSWYSSNYQIFQSPGYAVVFQELLGDRQTQAGSFARLLGCEEWFEDMLAVLFCNPRAMVSNMDDRECACTCRVALWGRRLIKPKLNFNWTALGH